ncbi:MAG: PEP-CTERM system histidine kinase PrsK [Hyphomicrobiales bacterium]|nr:PEP-CTERM system histidine kinase PrsK [Hyphomicrobiales bacterium]
MIAHAEVISYGICAVAFTLLTILIWYSKARSRYRNLLMLAAGATATWAASTALSAQQGGYPAVLTLLEMARNFAWYFAIGALLGLRADDRGDQMKRVAFFSAAAGCLVIVIGGTFVPIMHDLGVFPWVLLRASVAAQLLLSVLGLLILENLYRNADEERRWALKHICLGVGALFTYDFFLYADATLFRRIDDNLLQARGIIDAIAVPLIAVSASRSRTWDINLHVSRNIVFHSTVLLGSGLYLLVMSVAGYYLRQFGGDWGNIFQIFFFSAAIVLLIVLFSSGSIRAKVRVWISKNFFSYNYDYREEWLRFTRTISVDDRRTGLHQRIIRAVGNITQSTSGGLWVLRDEDSAFLPSATWNFSGDLPGEKFPAARVDSALVGFLARTHFIIDLDEVREGRKADSYAGLEVPDWLLNHPRAGLVVPLIHGDELIAFLVLGMPRARMLDWEVFDLLKTVGRQAASYLAEEQSAHALSDARRLEAFNRRSAFLIHDIKNVVSQMSLMVQNAEKFGDNPEFQKDMLATVSNSVIRMKELLKQFKTARDGEAKPAAGGAAAPAAGAEPVNLRALVGEIGDEWRRRKTDLALDLTEGPLRAEIDRKRLASVLDHLIQNAIEAAGLDGEVRLRLMRVRDNEALIEVGDNGPGMDDEYVRTQLFRPLDTGKSEGYGLGAYQARQLVREMGGRLEVASVLGKGTSMQVYLPVND